MEKLFNYITYYVLQLITSYTGYVTWIHQLKFRLHQRKSDKVQIHNRKTSKTFELVETIEDIDEHFDLCVNSRMNTLPYESVTLSERWSGSAGMCWNAATVFPLWIAAFISEHSESLLIIVEAGDLILHNEILSQCWDVQSTVRI